MTYEGGISIRGYPEPIPSEKGYRELTLSEEECRLVEERARALGLDPVEWVVLVVIRALQEPPPDSAEAA